MCSVCAYLASVCLVCLPCLSALFVCLVSLASFCPPNVQRRLAEYCALTPRSVRTIVCIPSSSFSSSEVTEDTFHRKDQHTFQVEVVMMIESTYHFANPASSVDFVVAHFRRGREVYPPTCYIHLDHEAQEWEKKNRSH